jgi:NTE family protein
MQRARGTAHWLTTRPVFLHHHVALTEDGEDIARLARFLTGRAIGMVLSGGGAFGVAHVGVWRAIRDLGIPLDIVGGTSVGSAMAGAIALGVPAEDIGPRVEAIFVRSGAMRRVTVPKYAFLDHKVLDAALQEHYGDGPIEDLWLPFYAVAADLSSMALTEIRTGPLVGSRARLLRDPRHPAALLHVGGADAGGWRLYRQHALPQHAPAEDRAERGGQRAEGNRQGLPCGL